MNSYEVKFKAGKRHVSQFVQARDYRDAAFVAGVIMGRIMPGKSLTLIKVYRAGDRS